MALKLDSKLRIGVITIHRRTEPATGPWQPSIDEMRELVELIDRSGYDSWGFRNDNNGVFVVDISVSRGR